MEDRTPRSREIRTSRGTPNRGSPGIPHKRWGENWKGGGHRPPMSAYGTTAKLKDFSFAPNVSRVPLLSLSKWTSAVTRYLPGPAGVHSSEITLDVPTTTIAVALCKVAKTLPASSYTVKITAALTGLFPRFPTFAYSEIMPSTSFDVTQWCLSGHPDRPMRSAIQTSAGGGAPFVSRIAPNGSSAYWSSAVPGMPSPPGEPTRPPVSVGPVTVHVFVRASNVPRGVGFVPRSTSGARISTNWPRTGFAPSGVRFGSYRTTFSVGVGNLNVQLWPRARSHLIGT